MKWLVLPMRPMRFITNGQFRATLVSNTNFHLSLVHTSNSIKETYEYDEKQCTGCVCSRSTVNAFSCHCRERERRVFLSVGVVHTLKFKYSIRCCTRVLQGWWERWNVVRIPTKKSTCRHAWWIIRVGVSIGAEWIIRWILLCCGWLKWDVED